MKNGRSMGGGGHSFTKKNVFMYVEGDPADNPLHMAKVAVMPVPEPNREYLAMETSPNNCITCSRILAN